MAKHCIKYHGEGDVSSFTIFTAYFVYWANHFVFPYWIFWSVYKISCEDCEATYVGETERSLKARFGEHRRPSSTTSQVSRHIHSDNPNHNITLENAKILLVEHKWFEGGVKEAIHIRALNPSLNRDGGCYNLPPIWNNIIKERLIENGAGNTNGGGGGSLRNSVSVPRLSPTPSGDCVTLMKATATVESSVSAVKLYPEEYSCNMYRMTDAVYISNKQQLLAPLT